MTRLIFMMEPETIHLKLYEFKLLHISTVCEQIINQLELEKWKQNIDQWFVFLFYCLLLAEGFTVTWSLAGKKKEFLIGEVFVIDVFEIFWAEIKLC